MERNKLVPTPAELELLKILWKIEPATVRQIHEDVSSRQNSAYTTTLKMFQIMHEKGFLRKDASAKAHVYTAIYSQQQTQNSIVKDTLHKVFGGSKFDLVVRALGDTTSADEISEIRKLLDTLEMKDKQ